MEFIIDNLVWFIAGGVVILMTFIGYFAEKTDFGKKLETENDEETEVSIQKKEKIKPDKKEKKNKKEEEKIESEAEKIIPVVENYDSNEVIPVPVVENYTSDVSVPVVTDISGLSDENQEGNISDTNVTLPIETNIIQPDFSASDAVESTEFIPTETGMENNVLDKGVENATDEQQTYQEPILEVPIMENVIPDELPVNSEETEINNTIPSIEDDANKNDLVFEEANGVIEDTPVIITDERVVPFEQLEESLNIPETAPISDPTVAEMELPSLETVAGNDEQSTEEDIWKF